MLSNVNTMALRGSRSDFVSSTNSGFSQMVALRNTRSQLALLDEMKPIDSVDTAPYENTMLSASGNNPMIQWQGKQWFSMLELTSELVNFLEKSTVTTKKKKTVTFADENGSQLETITIISEPSDVPPVIKSKIVLALLSDYDCQLPMHGSETVNTQTQWIINFDQPCLNYSNFRKLLHEQNVALESAMLQSDCFRIRGVVKVKNICFAKDVYIRYTLDDWKTFTDLKAEYMSSCGNEFDAFLFYLPTPTRATPEHSRIYFCICFSAGNVRYWDNNSNINYEVISDLYRRAQAELATQKPSVEVMRDCLAGRTS